jgi:hypothetical protein
MIENGSQVQVLLGGTPTPVSVPSAEFTVQNATRCRLRSAGSVARKVVGTESAGDVIVTSVETVCPNMLAIRRSPDMAFRFCRESLSNEEHPVCMNDFTFIPCVKLDAPHTKFTGLLQVSPDPDVQGDD